MLLSHDALEAWTAMLTIGGGGWFAYAQLQRARLEEKIADNTKMISTQWIKIDEIKENQAKYVTVDRHDELRREMSEMIEKAIRPVVDGQLRLEVKLDRFIEKQTQ